MSVVASGSITIQDANDGINLVFSKTNILLSTGADGIVASFAGAVSVIQVLVGATDLTSLWTITATPSTGVTGTLTGTTYSITGLSVDAGYITVTASQLGWPTLTGQINVSKVKQGKSGASLTLIPSGLEFSYTDGVLTDPKQQISIYGYSSDPTVIPDYQVKNGTNVVTDNRKLDCTMFGFGMYNCGLGRIAYIRPVNLSTARRIVVIAKTVDAVVGTPVHRVDGSTASAGATRNVFRGPWISGLAYAAGDTVTTSGGQWAAASTHTASGANSPPASGTSNATWVQDADRNAITTSADIAGSTWVDASANAAILAAGGAFSITGDVVTLYSSSGSYAEIRKYNAAGAWVALSGFLGGDALIDGAVTTVERFFEVKNPPRVISMAASPGTQIGKITIDRAAGALTQFQVTVAFDGVGNASLALELFRGTGSPILFQGFSGYTLGGRPTVLSFSCVDEDIKGGTTVYTLKARKIRASLTGGYNGDVNILKTFMSCQQFRK